MAIFKYNGRDGVYPFYRVINDLVHDKNLYVTEISHHVHAPSEYLCRLDKRFNIHIILNGKVWVNGQVLERGDGFFHHNMSYDSKKVCQEDFEEVTITFDGFTALQFSKDILGFENDFEFFKLRENNDLFLLKNAVYQDFTNINLDMFLLGKLYLLASYITIQHTTVAAIAASNPSKKFSSNKYLLKAYEYISAHYTEPITVEDLAEHLHLSQNYMCRLFKSVLGYTPQRYIMIHRVYIARHLLSCTSYSVNQISGLVGYNDAKHFSQVFKAITGYSPTDYRKKTTERDS